MATIATNNKGLVVTSGLKFCLLKSTGLNPEVSLENVNFDVENATVKSIPNPLPRKDVNEVPQPPKENLRILCCTFSENSDYIAFADDHKQLTVWSWKTTKIHSPKKFDTTPEKNGSLNESELCLEKQWNMVKRANKIIFDNDATSVIIADKSGDVFQFIIKSDNETEGKCILGHLSMVLDLKLSKCGKFIITCDRDEKIRVSHFPNAYNIHNFCLGHSDFVTCLEMFHKNNMMISGSGDGTLKVWDFLKGTEISSVTCAQDGKLDQLNINDNVDKNQADQLQIKRTTSWPSILGVRIFEDNEDETSKIRISVSLEKFNGILLYIYNNNQLQFWKKVLCSGPLWDHQFITDTFGTCMVLVQAVQNENIDIYNVEKESHKLAKPQPDFFKDAMATPDSSSVFVEELHKRWFDNVKEYLDKKRERVDNIEKKNKKKMKN